MIELSKQQKELLNIVQWSFPVCERPFEAIGEKMGISEETVIEELRITTVTYTATFVGGTIKTCSFNITIKETMLIIFGTQLQFHQARTLKAMLHYYITQPSQRQHVNYLH